MTQRYATLKEINEYYSIEEVLDMYEACLTNLHNKIAGIKEVKRR